MPTITSSIQELLSTQKNELEYFFSHLDLEKAEEIFSSLLSCKGTLVFTGIGKSGIIAKKIAMTLISTGTKAHFLSPSDALHGDIGVITPDDICIILSKSGSTGELLDLHPFIAKRGCQTHAWICEENTPLAKLCDRAMLLPIQKELCPFDLAPTTSTAAQLIFGDVLAIALMREKDFSIDDFGKNHPAGSIGKLSSKVADVMLTKDNLPLCFPENALSETLPTLSEKGCGCLLVVDNNYTLHGIFTDGDLRRALSSDNPLKKNMKDLMTLSCRTASPSMYLAEALLQMQEGDWVKELPVIEEGKLVGLIRMHDIIQAELK